MDSVKENVDHEDAIETTASDSTVRIEDIISIQWDFLNNMYTVVTHYQVPPNGRSITFPDKEFPKSNEKKFAIPAKMKISKADLPLKVAASPDDFLFLHTINTEGHRRAPIRTHRPHVEPTVYASSSEEPATASDSELQTDGTGRLEITTTSASRRDLPSSRKALEFISYKVDNAHSIDEETKTSPFEDENQVPKDSQRNSGINRSFELRGDEDIEEVINKLSASGANIRRAPMRNSIPRQQKIDTYAEMTIFEKQHSEDSIMEEMVKASQDAYREAESHAGPRQSKSEEQKELVENLILVNSKTFIGERDTTVLQETSTSTPDEDIKPTLTTVSRVSSTNEYNPALFYHTPVPKPLKKEKVLTFCTKDVALRDGRNMVIACGGELDVVMSISTIRRQVKNVAYNFSDAQVKAFTEVMSIIWKRLNDSGKNWRHVYKSLVLLDFLIKCGNDKVSQQCRENIFTIETLKDFQHIEDNRDQGLNIREKAKQITALLTDEERLKNERTRFMLTRTKFRENSALGGSSERRIRRSETGTALDPEIEDARPSSIGEEEMQLQIAIALSKEEHEKVDEMVRSDEVRLQLALEESQREAERMAKMEPKTVNSGQLTQSALDDLLSLGVGELVMNDQSSSSSTSWAGTGLVDPWVAPAPADQQTTSATLYPSGQLAQNDPWAPSTGTTVPTANTNVPTSSASRDVTSDPFSTWDQQLEQSFNATASANASSSGASSSAATAARRTPENFLGENKNLVVLIPMVPREADEMLPGLFPKRLQSQYKSTVM
ncbi:ENTH domain protein [Teladorsagia circumcincta]|uniref:ENTH domain protein n=1 Tax=Teladorsagia circumcincta TaxID=45464 RepID=A0A2G9V2K2_TELCI|nr:ENTH domain protein [Teladorsagia circumcincta]